MDAWLSEMIFLTYQSLLLETDGIFAFGRIFGDEVLNCNGEKLVKNIEAFVPIRLNN